MKVVLQENRKSSLEISQIYGYEGLMNDEVLCGSVEFYFRQVVGGNESLLEASDEMITLPDWTIDHKMVVQFEI